MNVNITAEEGRVSFSVLETTVYISGWSVKIKPYMMIHLSENLIDGDCRDDGFREINGGENLS